MLEGTFQLGPGLGPRREQLLWAAGLATWSAFEENARTLRLPGGLGEQLARRIDALREAQATGDLVVIAASLPTREHWRLAPWLLDRAAFLDIETNDDGSPTAIGVWGPAGPAIFLPEGCSRDRPLEAFPTALAGVDLLVTYNGSSFDVPILRRHFPSWQPPPVHVDLCHLWRRLGHKGGLKALERAQGIQRPPELAGLDGADATRLWRAARRHWHGPERGDLERGRARALHLFAAYNLADVAHLRPLLAMGYNRQRAELSREDWPTMDVPLRGEMLYDLSQALLGLGSPRAIERTFTASNPTRLF